MYSLHQVSTGNFKTLLTTKSRHGRSSQRHKLHRQGLQTQPKKASTLSKEVLLHVLRATLQVFAVKLAKTNYLYICFQPSISSRLIFYPDMRKENLLQNIASEGPTSSSTFTIETTVSCVTLTALHRTSRRHQYSVPSIMFGVRTSNFI